MNKQPIKTVTVVQMPPLLIFEEGFRRVHICGQIMGNLYLFQCGANTSTPLIPSNPGEVRQGMICKKCLAQSSETLDNIRANTLQHLGGEYPLEEAEKPNLQFINLTGHPITILDVFEKRVMAVNGNGAKAWVGHQYKTRRDAWLGDIPLKDLTISVEVRALDETRYPFPDPQPGVVYVVPAAIAAILLAQGRTDVYSPGPLVRDASGAIKGCIGLAQHLREEG